MQVNIDHIGYGNHILVRDITFTVSPGECLLLAGPNGSGKSTLLRELAGEICVSPTGWPWVRDTHISPVNCILVPTGIPKVKGFTVREFVRTGCYRESDWAGRLRKETEQRLEESLELIGLKQLALFVVEKLQEKQIQCLTGLDHHGILLDM